MALVGMEDSASELESEASNASDDSMNADFIRFHY